MPAPFSIVVHSLTPPELPQDTGAEVRSPLIPHELAATSSLSFTLSFPDSRNANHPLAPATRLQLSYRYENTGEVHLPSAITDRELIEVQPAPDARYKIELAVNDIPRAKVNHDVGPSAELRVHAWKGERFLGTWKVGDIEGLGITDRKSDDLAVRRAEVWRERQGATASPPAVTAA